MGEGVGELRQGDVDKSRDVHCIDDCLLLQCVLWMHMTKSVVI